MSKAHIPLELLTVLQHARRYPYLTEAALRDKIFHSRRRIRRGIAIPANGLAPAFHWFGRRVYIDPEMLRQLIAVPELCAAAVENARRGARS